MNTPLRPLRRCGQFKVSRELLLDDFEAVQAIFQLCVPVKAEMLLIEDAITYTAIGHVFDEVPKGAMAPWYDVTTDRDGLTVGVTFERCKGD